MEFSAFILLLVGGVFASALVIVILFIIINMCIKRKVANYSAKSANHTMPSYKMGSTFTPNVQDEVRPPLPPRNPVDTESMSNSYEEMPENPVVAEETSTLQKPIRSSPPETRISFQDNNSATESYDDVEDLHKDNAPSTDYLEVDPPQTQESDNGSESYDDVDQLHTYNEDYDDVG